MKQNRRPGDGGVGYRCNTVVRESLRGTQTARAISLTITWKNISAEGTARVEAQGLRELGVSEEQLADQRLQ